MPRPVSSCASGRARRGGDAHGHPSGGPSRWAECGCGRRTSLIVVELVVLRSVRAVRVPGVVVVIIAIRLPARAVTCSQPILSHVGGKRGAAGLPVELQLIRHVVHHDVDEHVHSTRMSRSRQSAQIVERSHARIQQCEVFLRVLVVVVEPLRKPRLDSRQCDGGSCIRQRGTQRSRMGPGRAHVFKDWRDPNGSATEPMNVIEAIGDASKVAALP